MSSCRDRTWTASTAQAVRAALSAVSALVCAAALHTPVQAQNAVTPATPESAATTIGRPATAREIAAWDIDVRPDFRGLPKGSGTVARGADLWEAKCASCHGVFGESNEVFSPLVGGTTAADVQSGRAARLTDPAFPGRPTLMKVATVSTLWDYIRRAMPWNNPKTLTPDDVYALVAYLLNLGGVVPDDTTLSDATIAQVQQRMPNRLGMTTDHGLWPGRGLGNGGRPDVQGDACMRNCPVETTVTSLLPEHARNAHGNLAYQNRLVGPQIGQDTAAVGAHPATDARARVAAAAASAAGTLSTGLAQPVSPSASPAAALAGAALLQQHGCVACHAVDRKVLGPALREVHKRYASRADAVDLLSTRIVAGGAGSWGSVPMPAQNLSPAEARALARWIVDGAR